MRAFVYEYITGGGTFSSQKGLSPEGSLLTEGEAMLRAIASDFLSLSGWQVESLIDARLSTRQIERVTFEVVSTAAQERAAFAAACHRADVALVIAPEIQGALTERTAWVEEIQKVRPQLQLISCSSPFVTIGSDKQATIEFLQQLQIPVPAGVCLPGPASLSAWKQNAVEGEKYVIKPLDGAGSWLQKRWSIGETWGESPLDFPVRCERFCPGLAASIGVISSENVNVSPILLPLLEQLQSPDDFSYLGARWVDDPGLVRRANHLARQVAKALPATTGFWGIDLVLGSDPEGKADFVIEVNPRITTSYIGLRQWCQSNLVEAMLSMAAGKKPALSWSQPGVEFRLAGPA